MSRVSPWTCPSSAVSSSTPGRCEQRRRWPAGGAPAEGWPPPPLSIIRLARVSGQEGHPFSVLPSLFQSLAFPHGPSPPHVLGLTVWKVPGIEVLVQVTSFFCGSWCPHEQTALCEAQVGVLLLHTPLSFSGQGVLLLPSTREVEPPTPLQPLSKVFLCKGRNNF